MLKKQPYFMIVEYKKMIIINKLNLGFKVENYKFFGIKL